MYIARQLQGHPETTPILNGDRRFRRRISFLVYAVSQRKKLTTIGPRI